MSAGSVFGSLRIGFLCVALCSAAVAGANGDRTTCGHYRGGQRLSPPTQITPGNVAGLKPAKVRMANNMS